MSTLPTAAGLSYRESKPEGWQPGGPTALLVHGWPESSYMWSSTLPALADVGYRAVAPDLAGYGDSAPDPPGTWERHVDALERFGLAVGLDHPALVVHDWGVPIGLRWACDHPDAVSAFVISNGGFFANRRWHDLANVMRTPGDGEALMESFTREVFNGALRTACPAMTDDALGEYWKAFANPQRRAGSLELYRSGDFDKLEPYEGRLRSLGLPTLVMWGANDQFASVAMAHRFHDELPGSELVIFNDAGHFIWDEQPQKTSEVTAEFLKRCS